MASFDDYRQLATGERIDRLRRMPDELAQATAGRDDAELSRRPVDRAWSPKEIVCHLRDVDELFQVRFHTILGAHEPTLLVMGADQNTLAEWGIGGPVGHPLDPERWAEERQYQRSDAAAALAAFTRRRGEVVALLAGLTPAQWQRGGIHPARGRQTLGDWVASLAAHDDNHLDQLRRAVAGQA